ncbi:MAG: PorT family protein [Chitinophagaceae bacterium]|nr:PorT family protein [Chitinophagaceae bacterium]MBL0273303.1 PorT family protein [Chitinophagaceae bacterium]
MKKLIIAIVLVTTAFISNGQARFGAKLGGNFFTLGGDDTKDTDVKNKIGFNFGFLANIPVSEHFSIQPELLYSIQGAKIEDVDDRINYNLNYLNVPIMLQFTSDGGFYGELGPQIGFLMSAKADGKIGGINFDEDIKDEIKGIDFGVAAGIGYKLPGGFGFNGRYIVGISNISDNPGGDIKNRGFQIGVFYMFGKSSKEKK